MTSFARLHLRDRRLAVAVVGAVLFATAVAALRTDGLTALAITAANLAILVATSLLVRRAADVGSAHDTPGADRLTALVEHSGEVALVVDTDTRPVYVSPSLERCFGWSPEEFTGFRLDEVVHTEDYATLADAIATVRADERIVETVQIRVRARTSWRWAEVRLRNELHDLAISGLVLTIRDITAQRHQQEILAARATQHGAIATLSRRALEGADSATLAVEATEVVVAGLGVQRSALFRAIRGHDQLLLAAVAGEDPDAEPRSVPLDRTTLVWAAMVDGQPVCVTSNGELSRVGDRALVGTALGVVVAGRERRYGVLTARSALPRTFTADDVHFLCTVATALALAIERRGAEEEAHNRALHDPLTALPNRLLFMDRLERALNDGKLSGRLTAVFFVDLDHFKKINDTMGHSAGDALLIGVADRLRDTLRPGDLVARFGGDEFTVLCEHLSDPEQAHRIADRIARALDDAVAINGQPVQITASVGFVLSNPAAGSDQSDALIHRADAAMYEAKGQGRNQVIFAAADATHDTTRERPLDPHLIDAVGSDQLFLEYQPLVDLASNRVTAAEALVRWQHPERGVVPPRELIPDTEMAGLIDQVGDWILARAAAQAVAWRHRGVNVVVSVNLSPRQLLRADFPDRLAAMLHGMGCRPEWLCLEIPESAMVSDLPGTAAGMEGLHRAGLRLAIDDFGSGYSSLSYLRRLPIDLLKFDRSLVGASVVDAQDRGVLGALVDMAGVLGLATVAVGVETPEQLAVVRSLGCTMAQGFLLSRPASAEHTQAITATGLTVPAGAAVRLAGAPEATTAGRR